MRVLEDMAERFSFILLELSYVSGRDEAAQREQGVDFLVEVTLKCQSESGNERLDAFSRKFIRGLRLFEILVEFEQRSKKALCPGVQMVSAGKAGPTCRVAQSSPTCPICRSPSCRLERQEETRIFRLMVFLSEIRPGETVANKVGIVVRRNVGCLEVDAVQAT